MSSTRRHSHGATRGSRSAKKAALSTDGDSATETGKTIFAGWTGELMQLQNETLQLLHKVRPKRKNSHQHTIGKGWASGAPLPAERQTAPRAATASSTHRGLSTRGSARGGGDMSMLLSDYHMDLAPSMDRSAATPLYPERGMTPMMPNPAHGEAVLGSRTGTPATELDERAGMSRGGARPSTATVSATVKRSIQAEGEERPMRVLDFDYESQRVVQAHDLFVPTPQTRLIDLEHERARLEAVLRRDETAAQAQARQKAEIAARKEWLRRDLAALRVQRLFRGHLGRRRFEIVKEMREIEVAAESEWVEVHDRDRGEMWYFNPITQQSQWERPASMEGVIASDDRVRVLPSVRTAKGDEGAMEKEAEKGRREATPEAGAVRPVSSSTPALPPMFPSASEESPARRKPADEEGEEGNEKGLFSDLESRLFSLDGKRGAMLRDTVKIALKTCKWDSVSTLLTDLAVVDGVSEQAEAQAEEEQEPELSDHIKYRKSLLPDPNRAKLMVAMVSKKDLSTASPARKLPSRKTPSRKGARRGPEEAATHPVDSPLGLAIRDVTTPGFEPPVLDGSKQAAIRAADQAATEGPPLIAEICFNCWSSGKGKKCNLHNVDKDGNPIPNRSGESRLMCKNWDLGVMRRRYRSEEIQEIFAKSASSLRYDRQRKVFLTVVEQKHPLYRSLNEQIAKHNLRSRALLHARMWVKSIVEYMAQKGNVLTGGKDVGRMYRAAVSIRNFFNLKSYSRKVKELQPQAPITGTSIPEKLGKVQYLFEEPHPDTSELVRFIISPPTPVPRCLYEPRRYSLPVPTPMELPDYKTVSLIPTRAPNVRIPEGAPGAWLEVFVASMSRDTVNKAKEQVKRLAPVSLAARIQRQKYPPPQTVRFAQFSRKPTLNNMAVGGLSPLILLSQLVQTNIPAQYGNLMVMETASIAPDISPEITASFKSIEVPFLIAGFDQRELVHALNTRKSPTISLLTGIRKHSKSACGANRPDQTGTKHELGFRTSQFADGLPIYFTIQPWAFTPTASVATLNRATSNSTVTSHADLNYPFCEPSSRPSTTMDYYHLLLTGVCTPNKSQIFTTFGMQLPGNYLKHGDPNQPLGAIVTAVYRSWAFKQKASIEEFVTDDGVPYWYDRKTGTTYWERPLLPIEQLPVKEGGTVVEGDNEPGETEKSYAGAAVVRYNSGDMRKVMLRKHETPNEVLERRKYAAQSAQTHFATQSHNLAAEQGTVVFEEEGEEEGAPEPGAATAVNALTLSGAVMSMDATHQPLAHSEDGATGQLGSARRLLGDAPALSARTQSGLASPTRRAGTVRAEKEREREREREALPSLKKADEALVNTLSTAIVQALPMMQDGRQSAEDLVRLGMGLGMHLQSCGIIDDLKHKAVAAEAEKQEQIAGTGMSLVSKDWVDSRKGLDTSRHPVGVPDADPRVAVKTASSLDHTLENDQRDRLANSKPLTLLDQVKGLKVVATPTPDEPKEEASVLQDPLDRINAAVPVLAHPPSRHTERDFDSHHAAGLGSSFVLKEESDKAAASKRAALRSLKDPIPAGFLAAIHERHVGKQYVDYLPNVPNLPQLNCIGAVKPRSAAEDWLAIGFDPWSAGKDPLQSEHCKHLGGDSRVDPTQFEGGAQGGGGSAGAFVDGADKEGLQKHAELQAELNKLEEDFNLIASYCRHGKYREIEEAISQVDWNLPIDHADTHGNTLLHVAVQNGSKRIAKLLLRRGADLNKVNLNGETVLHFAYAYGFDDLGDYLKTKGADDSIVNMDGLTCYEGLHQDDVLDL